MESYKNSKIAIVNGKIYTPEGFVLGTILIKGKKIKKVIFEDLNLSKLRNYKIIDASDSFVSYGFFDPHVHFRTPGEEYKEDWNSGQRAALKGGFTYVVDMPNNKVPITTFDLLLRKNSIISPLINFGLYLGLTDKNASKIKKIYKKAKKVGINVLGIKAFLGSSTGDLLINEIDSIKKALKTKLITLFHAEDEKELRKRDTIKYNSIYDHNIKRPPLAAVKAIIKIVKSCKNFKKNAQVYICHVSSYQEIKLIEKLRKKGFNILAEVTPHHLFFSLNNIKNSNIYKINPPIREEIDRVAVIEAFNSNFFNIIGTDHAPHLLKEKLSNNPPSGIPSLETAFYALYNLYENGEIALETIFKLLTNGYKIFKIKKRGEIKKGNFADITIIKKEEFIFDINKRETKADFSPFEGLKSSVKIDTVLINGKIMLKNGYICI